MIGYSYIPQSWIWLSDIYNQSNNGVGYISSNSRLSNIRSLAIIKPFLSCLFN